MSPRIRWVAAAGCAAMILASSRGHAEEGPPCASKVTRATLVSCALGASLVVRAERQGRTLLEARKSAASPLLPSNPVVSFSAGRTTSSTGTAGTESGGVAWDASLSQELEIGGQRGTRRAAVDAEMSGQQHRIAEAERDVAASAWRGYFDLLAAKESAELSARLLSIGQAMAAVAAAKAEAGLSAPIDADVADATAVSLAQAKFAAERRLASARLNLAGLLGVGTPPASWSVDGDLAPLAGVDSFAPRGSVDTLPTIQAAEADRRAALLRADVFRRAGIPNPTVSVFTQNYERSFGAGLSVPIPLPSPIGRTYSGEVAESEALAEQAATRAEQLRRDVALDLASAVLNYDARKQEAFAFGAARVARAEDSLKNIADQIQAGRLAVRDAIVAEQTLVGLLRDDLEARHALCVASVELARAAGLALDRVQ